METKDCILKRRSIREYLDKEVSDSIIKTILESAMAAPSAKNEQAWEFYVIKNKEIQEKIKAINPALDKNSPLLIVVCGVRDSSRRGTLNDFWIQDCSAAIENMLLTATDLGLGSLWCGLFPRLDRAIKVKEILNIPASSNVEPLGLVHIGYMESEKEPRTQYNEEKVHIIL